MPRNSKSTGQPVTAEQLLRSINVTYDAAVPERIAHFRPTSKCASLIGALIGQEDDRAFMVVAPYGTGKSLTATYLLQLIENRGEAAPVLLEIAKRLHLVSAELGRFADRRRRNCEKWGLVVPLHGHCDSVAEALKQSVIDAMSRQKMGRQARPIRSMPCRTMQDGIEILRVANEKCREYGGDRIAIVWDEFGRHLEALITQGAGDALAEVQLLAEFVARSHDLPMTLGLLLHQGLLHYTGNAAQSVRNDWLKIEGRFKTIQYVDDSKEIYRLIADVMTERAPDKCVTKRAAKQAAQSCLQLGLFSSFTQTELTELLHSASPIDPVTLYLLPRVSARVAQNERTLFSFLYAADLAEPVTPAELYDFFAPAMRSDTSVGGTHRQWLETESALSKVPDNEQGSRILKSACLLGLGTSGERSRTSRELLTIATSGFGIRRDSIREIDGLIERKLLLHRKHNDEVSVWHGTDLDLRGRLEEEHRRRADDFDLLQFLDREAKPPAWKPLDYNDDFCVRRFLEGEYRTVSELNELLSWNVVIEDLPADCDGRIVYLVAETPEALETAENFAREKLDHERLIVAIPREPLQLAQAALEVDCLSRMELDAELLEADPLALPEIQQMADDSRDHLQRLIDRLIRPSSCGPRWFYRGSELNASDPAELRRVLSDVMRNVYHLTPRINNEMIVRRKPSPVIINSRKKLLLGILERHGQEQLGLEGNFPDMSMFRTVLLNTGIYRKTPQGSWGYAAPPAVSDPGLRAVWDQFRKFLTEPHDHPKDFRSFFEELSRPPYGLRAGLFPILLSAALKAFPAAISLMRNGEYVVDILPSEIENLCRNPDQYKLAVLDLDETKSDYLRTLHGRFSAVESYEISENDLIRLCFDAIEAWKGQLPPAALSTRNLSRPAERFRRTISSSQNPVQLLFDRLPASLECRWDEDEEFFALLDHCMDELTGVTGMYVDRAGETLRRALALHRPDDSLRDVGRYWAECFSDGFTEELSDGVAKGFLSRLRMSYETDERLLNSLGSLLVGKAVARWDDSTVAQFDREVQNVTHRIEEMALSTQHTVGRDSGAAQGLAALVRSRMKVLYDRLAQLIGEEEARQTIDTISRDIPERMTSGNDPRSS